MRGGHVRWCRRRSGVSKNLWWTRTARLGRRSSTRPRRIKSCSSGPGASSSPRASATSKWTTRSWTTTEPGAGLGAGPCARSGAEPGARPGAGPGAGPGARPGAGPGDDRVCKNVYRQFNTKLIGMLRGDRQEQLRRLRRARKKLRQLTFCVGHRRQLTQPVHALATIAGTRSS